MHPTDNGAQTYPYYLHLHNIYGHYLLQDFDRFYHENNLVYNLHFPDIY